MVFRFGLQYLGKTKRNSMDSRPTCPQSIGILRKCKGILRKCIGTLRNCIGFLRKCIGILRKMNRNPDGAPDQPQPQPLQYLGKTKHNRYILCPGAPAPKIHKQNEPFSCLKQPLGGTSVPALVTWENKAESNIFLIPTAPAAPDPRNP